MKIEEFNNFYHVDISTQIDNNWENDSALGIVKDSRKFSILIKGRDKEILKRRFISKDEFDSAKKHNKKVIAIVYSYLLYKSLCEFSEAKPLLLCRDVRPERFVIHYLQRICNFFKRNDIFNRIIKFRKRIEFETQEKLPKSLAGRYARKVYQGKIPPNKIIDNSELEELIDIINKLL
jgi:hypothetical protein